jgi:hypothetical protein
LKLQNAQNAQIAYRQTYPQLIEIERVGPERRGTTFQPKSLIRKDLACILGSPGMP